MQNKEKKKKKRKKKSAVLKVGKLVVKMKCSDWNGPKKTNKKEIQKKKQKWGT